MTCEEFAIAGLDLGTAGEEGLQQTAAREHLQSCPHCAALHENWQVLRADLRSLGAEARESVAPPRVEMRLRQEFRTRHVSYRTRRAAVIAGWALASAAVLVGSITWFSWRHEQDRRNAQRSAAASRYVVTNTNSTHGASSALLAGPELGETLVASSDSGEFTLLPGSMPGLLEDAAVVRVQMQRGALSALGLTVNEERASEWIQVDLLVGDDGQPQALRLPQSAD
jgi:predicted anti-sigma-YlaC factor YlaD